MYGCMEIVIVKLGGLCRSLQITKDLRQRVSIHNPNKSEQFNSDNGRLPISHFAILST